MSSLLSLNASPRGPRSNSARMLAQVEAGWVESGGVEPTRLNLAIAAQFEQAVEQFALADTVIIAMPLYTDSMPALVMRYIERLADRVGREDNPRIAFLVQSGFSEALHSRGLERYLAKLASRLNSSYAGTIVRGGGESLQAMPDPALRGLFARLHKAGAELASDGAFADETLAAIAGTERLSPAMAFGMKIAVALPITQFYWNGQLKKNNAWDLRFDAPYAPAASPRL